MHYTVDDYNVTIKRGFVHPETGQILWGTRKKKGVKVLDFREPKSFVKANLDKNEASRNYHAKHKKKLREIKLSKGCELCNFGKHKFPKKYEKHVALLLEFDHLDTSSKGQNISDMAGGKWSKAYEEMSKCRVLCKPCHVNHTAEQRRIYKKTGGKNGR